jgi:AcrR family transcriptional regulator
MTNEKRVYRMSKRAETQAQTRQRILDSAIELHATIGPAQTTIIAVAKHAGIPRSTVYRHFQDEAALIVACSLHWQSENQPPDPSPWTAIDDPDTRLQTALTEIYGYYAGTGLMLDNVLRDETTMPILTELLGRFRQYFEAVHEILMAGRTMRGAARRRTSAAISHALAFSTWRSLAHQLTNHEAAALMVQLTATTAEEKQAR